jgi:Phage integrase family
LHQAEPVTIAKLRWLLGKSDTNTRGDATCGSVGEGRVCIAADDPGKPSLRGDPCATAGSEPGNRLGPARFQPCEVRHPEHAPACQGETPVRVVAADRGRRREAQSRVRANGRLRSCDRTGAIRALRTRTARRRPRGRSRVRATRLRERQARAHEDTAQQRAVPLQAKAFEALDRLPRSESEILFPNSRGGRIDFRSFGRRHWKPAQRAAGTEPLRDLYDLRHTYATFALRAGVPVFGVSRFMGSSIAMIDHHYGHLAHDSRQHAVSLLDALAFERAVDAAWTSPQQLTNQLSERGSRPGRPRPRRAVDAR